MIKKCAYCGKEFKPQHYLTKYCSDKCRIEAYRKYNRERSMKLYEHKNPKLMICPICGKSFWRKGKENKKYCSPECSREGHRINCSDYNRRVKNKKKIDACKAKHNGCYDCDMPVGVCKYD